MKKITRALLVSATLAGLVACGGGTTSNGDNSSGGNTSSADSRTKTIINVYNFMGGVGKAWLENAAQRFAELTKDKSYEDGKVSVYINIDGDTDATSSLNSMKSTATQMYFSEKGNMPKSLAQSGALYDITEWINEENPFDNNKKIIDKVDSGYQDMLKANDGHTYALPHYEWYSGLTYDREAFEDKITPLYFAGPEASDPVDYDGNFGDSSFKFISDISDKDVEKGLSCGIDGVYGTDDDGLPSSIQEFLVLCDYMKQNNVVPLVVTGNHIDYTAYLLQAFLGAFEGADGLRNYYDFNGEIDVVTGYDSTKELFYEGSGVAAPITEKITLTEANGYHTRNTVARYYTTSLLYILNREEFFHNDSKSLSNYYNVAHSTFVNGALPGQQKCGFLIEGNYWYNEGIKDNLFTDFKRLSGGREDRDLGWLPIPSQLSGSVKEAQGSAAAPLLDTGYSFLYVNGNMTSKCSQGVIDAVKDFVQFLYSDAELSNFTKSTGICKAGLDYDYYSDSVIGELSQFQKDVIMQKKHNADNGVDVVLGNGGNATFNNDPMSFLFGIEAPIWQPKAGTNYRTYIQAFREGKSVKDVFEGVRISEDDWNTKYYKA